MPPHPHQRVSIGQGPGWCCSCPNVGPIWPVFLGGENYVVVSQLDAQTYRERAAQCLALAERAQRDDDKATWLELAGKWQRLLEETASRGRSQQQQQPRAASKRFP